MGLMGLPINSMVIFHSYVTVYQGVIIFHILVPAKSSSRSPSPAAAANRHGTGLCIPQALCCLHIFFGFAPGLWKCCGNADVSAADAIGIAQFMAVYVGKMVMNMI
jgi:hypothetical protein